ncbi:MAG: hypothetical protein IJ841_03810 [Prevotella sp.]|nr:hypothetical protein [Prevotella sp.]
MKTARFFIAIALLGMATTMQAQLSDKQVKERQAALQKSKADLDAEASLLAQKEARKLQKQGWEVSPGALPMEKQLDKSYALQQEYDETLFPKYFYGEGRSTGQNYDAAKMQATELAKIGVVTQIQTELTALVETNVATKQLSPEEAVTVTNSVMAAKELISQSLGRYLPVVELHRTLKNKNTEVLVRIAYNSKMAKAAAKAAAREDLEKQGGGLMQKCNDVLGW